MNGQKKRMLRTSRWLFALYIGFFAGLIWGALKIVEQYLKFTKVAIGFLVEPFFKHDFLFTWKGGLVGWFFFTLFSIAAAFLYTIFLGKLSGPWWGVAYGVAWWGVLYLLVGPYVGLMYWIHDLDANTIISDFCLFLLWGLFIGYSIAIEYTDERTREPIHNA